MKKKWMRIGALILALVVCMGLMTGCNKAKNLTDPKNGDTIAILHTNMGDISLQFFDDIAPKAVENFLTHAEEGYYDGVIFHRVIEDFMIQSGDPMGTGTGGESIWGEPFELELSDDAFNLRGALCMANTGSAVSNGSQFYIVQAGTLTDAHFNMYEQYGYTFTDEQKELYKTYGGAPWLDGGYTVFGQVIDGMDVVDAIAVVEVDDSDKPLEDVVIESIEITKYKK